ncbi:3D domain-containing protein [Winogradskyella sediminis]|uniref:3D domain-containing protein n=1 Tax=Winogradskyella sediminis TaxID=1382466 RepID=UPI003AA86D10
MKINYLLMVFCYFNLYNCNDRVEEYCQLKTFKVTATAYNSLVYQTNSNPNITAFGDSLKPGMRYLAVSRDLLDSGLVYNTQVKIEGFDSLYIVKDKMNRRYYNRIDIYMDNDIKRAKQWGKKNVVIEYCIPPRDTITN